MSRYVDILKRLDQDHYITSRHIATQLGVSDRTIREDLKELSVIGEAHGFQILSKPHYGNKIVILDSEKYRDYLMTNDKIPQDHISRTAYVILVLLDNDHQYLSVPKIAGRLFLSESRVSALLKNVDDILSEFSLSLQHKKNSGIMITGQEMDKRMCIVSLLTRFDVSGYFREFESESSIHAINEVVQKVFDQHDLYLDEIFYDQFIILLFVNLRRIRQNKRIDTASIDPASFEFRVIGDLCQRLTKSYATTFTDEEKGALAIKLSGMRDSSHFAVNTASLYIKEDVYALSKRIIDLVSRDFSIDLSNDFDLQVNLAQHLVPMIIRVKYAIITKNPLKDMIKQKYAFGYQMSVKAAPVIEEVLHKKISEDELAYLALIFSLSLEKEKRYESNYKKKNIALICGSSNGSAHLLMYKYKNEFSDDLNRIEVFALKDLKNIDFQRFDYIFSTVPIIADTHVPIIQVGYFLDSEDKARIRAVFNTPKNDIMSEFYAPDQFITHIRSKERFSVIEEMIDHGKEKYGLDKAYYDSVVTRELLAKTAFGNLVAMPHSVETIVQETFVYVGILDRPIAWGNEEVQVVFLTNIGKIRGKSLVKFYDLTMRFMMDAELVKMLIHHRDFHFFIDMLASLDNVE